MAKGIIQVDPRHTVRRIRTATQGNAIRSLVELVTNANDSYIRLKDEKNPNGGKIEILYKKEGQCGCFAVRDNAEGMSIEEVMNSFTKYGSATSGMKAGERVRGYFGQGAKDALADMVDGKICTFKDDVFVECKLFIEHGQPWYDIDDPTPATMTLRNKHKITGNGTVAYFKVDPQKTGSRVPKFTTVHDVLASNYQLRKLMTNPNRKVILINEETGEKLKLRYQMPKGKEILVEDIPISYDNYGDFPVHISIWRSERELTQSGDDRDGGLLIIDDEAAVLEMSLFKYDNEPLAARFFGEVVVNRFRELLKKEETVLSEEREGLVRRHPFCQKLILEIEKRLELKVREERLRKQKEEECKIDREETERYKKAFNILNEIAEQEVQSIINLGQKTTDQIEEPPNGFCIYPASAQITVGKRYNFELRLNTRIIHHGAIVKLSCTNSKIRILTPEVKISSDDGTGILRKYITVEGTEPNVDGILRASTENNISEAKINVIPEKELLLSEGLDFQPGSITLRPNHTRKVYLLVYIKIIGHDSVINISSDNDAIHISKETITVNEFDAERHIAKYELEVYGEGDGQDAIITAKYDENLIALLGVRIRSKEKEDDKGRKGMFNEPCFDPEPDPLQRSSYSSETGKVHIYVNFPSVQHYLGDNRCYVKTLPAQVLIADLIAEQCFRAIATKEVEFGSTLSPGSVPEKIQFVVNKLSKSSGKKVHQALVDQKLLESARSLG